MEEIWRTRSWMVSFWALDCDQTKFLLEQPEELSRRAHYEDELRKNNGSMNSPSKSKEILDNLFLGSTAIAFLQQSLTEQECPWKKIRQMLVWDNRMKSLIHRKHEKF